MKLKNLFENVVWKQIVEWPNYEVSNTGLVRSKITNKIMKPWESMRRGGETDLRITLSRKISKLLYVNGKREDVEHTERKGLRVHRLVANAFLPNPNNLPEVDHIDGNAHNNDVLNLEWVSSAENIQRMYRRTKK